MQSFLEETDSLLLAASLKTVAPLSALVVSGLERFRPSFLLLGSDWSDFCCLPSQILCKSQGCATTEFSPKAWPWGSIALTGNLSCVILSLGLQAQLPRKIWTCFSPCPGAWETRSWKGGDDSAASLPVYTAAAWDRHVQPKCKSAFCLVPLVFSALQLSRTVPILIWLTCIKRRREKCMWSAC